ncbi:MAG: cytochrome c peroxidase [Chitinophagales bacterium]
MSNSKTYETHPYKWDFDTITTPLFEIPEDNPMTVEGVALGRLLFYDSLLSGNNKQSCGTCHQQRYSFSDGKKLAVGTFGDTLKVNTISLINLGWNKHFFWDGRVKKLEDVMPVPMYSAIEMGETETNLLVELNKHKYYPVLFEQAFGEKTITAKNVYKALAQFLRTIVSIRIQFPDSVLNIPPVGVKETDFFYQNLKAPTLRGTYFRFAAMCNGCHVSDVESSYTQLATNGINDSKHLMKIPSLYNLAYTAPYMHDGSLKTIEEVFEHYDKHIANLIDSNPQITFPQKFQMMDFKNEITDFDKKNGHLFFQLLTDSNLLTNIKFSDPFKEKSFSWSSYIPMR